MEITTFKPGMFCWTDLRTEDLEGAKRFYGTIFGWKLKETPIGTINYTMALLGKRNCCALSVLTPDQRTRNIPPHWNNYISVDDVDDKTNRVSALGGTVVAPAFDVGDVGRTSVIQDPTGGTLSLWQSKKSLGPLAWNEDGAVCWLELLTHNVDRATSFYTQLLGWTAKADTNLKTPYTVFSCGDTQVGGATQITKDMGTVPSHWCTYFAVDNCDRWIERAKAHGAKILVPPQDVPNIGRFATLQDPHGAVFSVIRMTR